MILVDNKFSNKIKATLINSIIYKGRVKLLFFTVALFVTKMTFSQPNSSQINVVIDSLKIELSKSQDDTIRLKTLAFLAKSIYNQNPALAMVYAKEALVLAKQTGKEIPLALLYNTIGNIYRITSEYPKAFSCFFQSLKIFERLNNKVYPPIVMNNIAANYITLKKYKRAKFFLNESVKISLNTGLDTYLGYAYSNLAIIAFNENRLSESLKYYHKAIKIHKKQGKELSAFYNNIGDIYVKLHNPKIAEKNYLKALDTLSNNNNEYISFCTSLGEFYSMQKDFKKAAYYLFRALNIADKYEIDIFKPDVLASIVTMYEKQGDYKNANSYLREFQRLKDSSLNETTERQISKLQIEYETDKKDKEIKLLNKDKEVVETRMEKATLIRNLFILAFFFIVIISFILWRNNYLKQKINKLLKQKNIALEDSNRLIAEQKKQIETINHQLNNYNAELQKENVIAQYQVLKSKTNPHFLFNSLTTLSTLIIKDKHMALDYVEKFSELYRHILKTDEQKLVPLAYELNIVNQYLYLQKIRFKQNLLIEVDLKNDERYLPPFSLQMVVENAIKHNVISDDDVLYIRHLNFSTSSVISPRSNASITEF
jgi:sensor histidine kinase YesM